MINVTKTFFPPIEEYNKEVQRIWDNQWITNGGHLYKELSAKLQSYLKVNHVLPTTNGTLPIQIALNAFGKEGEVITTPFSYVATTASIIWEKCTPVFVDIHPEYLTIDESKIEAAITDKTTTILATHVYGNPCNVEEIEKIAQQHGLKVIYDAAHCFGVTYKGTSVFNYGDVSTCSFHATKLFHTGEGGALFCQDADTFHEMYYRHNFGHNGTLAFHGLGINAKMSELQAAMGLCVLPYMEDILSARKEVVRFYNKNIKFKNLKKLKIRENTCWNFSYYPVVFETETVLLMVLESLNSAKIYPRRYFYPSLNNLDYLESHKMPISDSIATRVLCLPLYYGLQKDELENICNIINSVINKCNEAQPV